MSEPRIVITFIIAVILLAAAVAIVAKGANRRGK